MDNRQLDIMHLRRSLYLIFVILVFAFFSLTFCIYSLFDKPFGKIGFALTFVFYLFVEIPVLAMMVARLRHVSDGVLNFNHSGIFFNRSSGTRYLAWEEIKRVKFYYRGDQNWRLNIGRFYIHIGAWRYFAHSWNKEKDIDEMKTDKIDIDGQVIYIKIRDEKDKTIFHELISMTREKGIHSIVVDPEIATVMYRSERKRTE
jgi:hypothetical protein